MIKRKRLYIHISLLIILLLLVLSWGIHKWMDWETTVIDIDENTVTRTGLTFIPYLDENYIWVGGLGFTLERLVDDVWVPVEYTGSHVVASINLFIQSGESTALEWSDFYGVLDDGTYRLVKQYAQHTGKMGVDGLPNADYNHNPIAEFTYYGVFEITSNTPEK